MNQLSRKKEDLLCLTTLEFFYIAVGLYMWAKGCLEEYMSILAPIVILTVTVFLIASFFSIDSLFTMCMLILLNIGLVMQVIINQFSPIHTITVTWISVILGVMGSVVVWVFQNKISAKSRFIFCMILSIIIYLVLVAAGAIVNGSKAWIRIGNWSFQPTEITKLVAVYSIAITYARNDIQELKKFVNAFLVVGINAFFLLLLREMGTLAIIGIIFIVMTLLFLKKRYIILSSISGIVGVGIVVGGGFFCSKMVNEGNQNRLFMIGASLYEKIISRVFLLLHPESMDRYNEGYQYYSAKKAMEIGGWFGSKYKVEIPVAYSDYVFPSLLHSFGYAVGILVLMLFIIWYIQAMKSIMKNYAKSKDTIYAASGFINMILIQSMLTILGSTGCFLLMGLPIAFLSAGGSNQLTLSIMISYFFYAVGQRRTLRIKRN